MDGNFSSPKKPPSLAFFFVVFGGLALDDNKLYVVSPVGSKLVVGAMSTTLTNSNQFYENADLTQNFTMRKNYGFEFVGAQYAGLYSITE